MHNRGVKPPAKPADGPRVTSLHEPANPPPPPLLAITKPPFVEQVRQPLEPTAVLLAFVVFELFVVQAGGGRDEGAVTKGLLGLVPALVLTRPWARLSRRVQLAAALPAVGALLMCVTSPLAWAGADQLATAAYAGLLFMVVAAFGVNPRRRLFVALLLAGTAVWQCMYALWVWTAGADIAKPLIGTYYWHNPFAVHAAVGALILTAVVLTRAVSRTWAATAGAAVCVVATALSTSRATLLLLVLTTGAMVVAALMRDSRLSAVLARLAVLTGATLATAVALLGPFLTAPGTGVGLGERTANESFTESGTHRLSFYAAALHVIADEPWAGVGAGGFRGAATLHQGPLEARAKNVHSGVLQAAVEGGVPLAVLYSLPLFAGAVGLVRRLGNADSAPDIAVLHGAGAAFTLLAAHSLIDFDWSFQALPALLAAVLGLVVAVPRGGRGDTTGRRGGSVVVILTLLLGGSAASLRADAADAAVRASQLPTENHALLGVAGPLGDRRFDRLILADPGSSASDLAAAVTRTARLGELDVTLEWLRAEALIRLGDREQALSLAEGAWARARANAPLQAIRYSRVLDAAGQPEAAERVLVSSSRRLMALGPEGVRRAQTLVEALEARPGPSRSKLLNCLVLDLAAALPSSRFQKPPTTSGECRDETGEA